MSATHEQPYEDREQPDAAAEEPIAPGGDGEPLAAEPDESTTGDPGPEPGEADAPGAEETAGADGDGTLALADEPARLREEAAKLHEAALNRQAAAAELREEAARLREEAAALRDQAPSLLHEAARLREETRAAQVEMEMGPEAEPAAEGESEAEPAAEEPRGLVRRRRRR